jgi:hypothetical protein
MSLYYQLSRALITKYASGVPTTDLRNCVNDLVNILLEKLGDSNSRTKDAATEALMFLATRKEIGLPIIANPLLRPPKNQVPIYNQYYMNCIHQINLNIYCFIYILIIQVFISNQIIKILEIQEFLIKLEY